MGFCTQCGTKLDENGRCSNCGFEKKTTVTSNGNKLPSIKTSKKAGIMMSIIAAVIIIFGVTYFSLANHFSKDKVAERFETALSHNDVNALSDMISSADPKMKVTKTNIKHMLDYFKSHPSEQAKAIALIKKQAKSSNNMSYATFVTNHGFPLFWVKNEGKKWLFFNDYVFEVQPFYIKVATNFDGTKITVNKKSTVVNADENSEIGPFFPGSYTVKATWEGPYATLKKDETIDLIDPEQKILDVDMSMDGQVILPASNYPMAEVYINGKDTHMTVQNAIFKGIGPVILDGKTSVSAKMSFPWGEVESDKYYPTKNVVQIKIKPLSDEQKKAIIDMLNQFAKERAAAYNALDVSKFTVVTENQKKSEQDYIDNMKSSGKKNSLKLEKTMYNADMMKVGHDVDGNYLVLVSADFIYSEKDADSSDLPLLIQIRYNPDDQTWRVDYTSDSWGYNPSPGAKTFEFK